MEEKIFISKLKKNINSDDYISYILYKFYNVKNITIKRTKNNKPYIENSNIKYSISHKKNYIVAIVSNKDIGIDLEIIDDKNRLHIAKKYFLKNEIEYINSSKDKNLSFLKIWTKKEAYIKKYGLNLSHIKKIDSLNENIFTFIQDKLIISICT